MAVMRGLRVRIPAMFSVLASGGKHRVVPEKKGWYENFIITSRVYGQGT